MMLDEIVLFAGAVLFRLSVSMLRLRGDGLATLEQAKAFEGSPKEC